VLLVVLKRPAPPPLRFGLETLSTAPPFLRQPAVSSSKPPLMKVRLGALVAVGGAAVAVDGKAVEVAETEVAVDVEVEPGTIVEVEVGVAVSGAAVNVAVELGTEVAVGGTAVSVAVGAALRGPSRARSSRQATARSSVLRVTVKRSVSTGAPRTSSADHAWSVGGRVCITSVLLRVVRISPSRACSDISLPLSARARPLKR
jgi:hypothetical protein